MDIEQAKKKLKTMLTERRYNHSIGTMKMAKEFAKIYGEDEQEAELAGLIHDAAKELPREKAQEYIDKYNVEFDEFEKQNPKLWHSKLGEVIAREEFGASKQVQEAIRYHTTGDVNMNTFDKIIYMADKIEENRTYDDVEKLREIAKRNLDEAVLATVNRVVSINKQKHIKIHPGTLKLKRMLERKLK